MQSLWKDYNIDEKYLIYKGKSSYIIIIINSEDNSN